MNLYKETHNGRECLFGYDSEEDSVVECLKEAFSKNLISENKKLFFGYSRLFAELSGNYIRTCRMRENWNGWHDCAIYDTSEWRSVGKKVYANPSEGLHRDTVDL